MIRTIILIVVVVVILYLLVNYFSSGGSITPLTDAKTLTTISSSKFSAGNQGSNFTYSIWFYIADWNYKYGETKTIIAREGDKNSVSPMVALGAMTNDLSISQSVYSNSSQNTTKVDTCNIDNIPLQKWVCLVVSVYGKSMDVYLDGKLVKTCILSGVAKVDYNAPVQVTPRGGFSGYTGNLQYWPNATNPQQAWNIYKSGYGSGALGNLFNRYRLKISFLENNKEGGSFEL